MKLFLKLIVAMSILLSGLVYADDTEKVEVVAAKSRCSYFVVEGKKGFYLLELYRGYDPSKGDVIVGDINSYGRTTIHYIRSGREATVYVDEYKIFKTTAMKKYEQKCKRY